MATNGSMTTGMSHGRSIRFDWWINRQDTAGNYTEIGWNLVGDGTYTGTNNQGYINCGPFDLWISGTQFYKGDRLQVKKGDIVNSGTHILYHDTSGNCTFIAALSCAVYDASLNVSTGDHSWQLPNIPRKAELTTTYDFNDDQNPIFYFNNPGSFWLAFSLEWNNQTQSISRILDAAPSSPYTLVLTDAERDRLRKACEGDSMPIRMVIATSIAGSYSQWSWQDKTFYRKRRINVFSQANVRKLGDPYVYTEDSYKRGIPYVYKDGSWKMGTS